MMYKIPSLPRIVCACLLLLTACGHKTEKNLPAEEVAYIRQLGLLEKGETISRYEGNLFGGHSGSFFTDRRIAGYWVNDDEKETHSAFYPDIDSLTLTDKTQAVTLASYVTVYAADQSPFHVYIDLDSAGIHSFFNAAESAWKQYR
jgi:hypothetical protein